jgi:hypothetical protein
MQFVAVGEEEAWQASPPPWVAEFSVIVQFVIFGEDV